jgi:hypothetical protein
MRKGKAQRYRAEMSMRTVSRRRRHRGCAGDGGREVHFTKQLVQHTMLRSILRVVSSHREVGQKGAEESKALAGRPKVEYWQASHQIVPWRRSRDSLVVGTALGNGGSVQSGRCLFSRSHAELNGRCLRRRCRSFVSTLVVLTLSVFSMPYDCMA